MKIEGSRKSKPREPARLVWDNVQLLYSVHPGSPVRMDGVHVWKSFNLVKMET